MMNIARPVVAFLLLTTAAVAQERTRSPGYTGEDAVEPCFEWATDFDYVQCERLPIPGQTGMMGQTYTLADGTLDPELFERAGATLAPTLLLEDLNKPSDLGEPSDLDAGLIVARAEGLTDPDWLYDQMKKGQPDQRSPNVVEIEEEDLRARAAREAEQVAQRLSRDADTLKDRFWKRTGDDLEGMAITPASADRTRQLHFMFKTSQPITDQDGRVLAHAGEVFQPSDVLPFDRRIFVFNPNDPDELQFVEDAFKAPRPNVNRTLLILTELPTVGPNQQPWYGLQAIVDRFGIQAFLLNDQFRNAFKIEVTPTEIYPIATNGTESVISAEYSLN